MARLGSKKRKLAKEKKAKKIAEKEKACPERSSN